MNRFSYGTVTVRDMVKACLGLLLFVFAVTFGVLLAVKLIETILKR